jgi:hypothetical protein
MRTLIVSEFVSWDGVIHLLLCPLLHPLARGSGKRLFPQSVRSEFRLQEATSYPSGVVGLDYENVEAKGA